jgi:hypothetical protein
MIKYYPNNDRINYPNKKPNKNLEFGQDSGISFGPYSNNKNIFGQHSVIK